MHAVRAPLEIDIGRLTAQIACMILPDLSQTNIMQAMSTVVEIDKSSQAYEPPA